MTKAQPWFHHCPLDSNPTRPLRGSDLVGLEKDLFDKADFRVDAKAENAVEPQQMRRMLQSLLEERFKLKTHTESRERKVYLLLVDKNGPKFQQSKDEQGNPITERPPLPKMPAGSTKEIPGILRARLFPLPTGQKSFAGKR